MFEPNKSKDQYIKELTGLNNSNRYQQMVRTTADIMNNAFEKISKKNVVKNVNIVKYPFPMFAGFPTTGGNENPSTSKNKTKEELERELLKNKINDKNYSNRNSQDALNKRLKELEKNPEQYFYDQTRRDAQKNIIINRY